MNVFTHSLHPNSVIGIICHGVLGGSSKMGLMLAKELATRGYQVIYYSIDKQFWPLLADSNIKTIQLPMPPKHLNYSSDKLHESWDNSDSEVIADFLFEEYFRSKINVFHFHYGNPFAAIGAQLKIKIRNKLGLEKQLPRFVITLHGTDVYYVNDTYTQSLRKEELKHFDVVTTVSQSLSDLAKIKFSLCSEPKVIYNFTHFTPLDADRKETATLTLAHISNFRPIKNLAFLAEVFINLLKIKPARLILVGDGPDFKTLKQLLIKGMVWNKIEVAGVLKHGLDKIFMKTDILLMTSNYESFCLTALEAMAFNVPVVAPNIGGFKELIKDFKNGCLFSPGNIIMAVNAILDAYNLDKNTVKKTNSQSIENKFSSQKIINNYIKCYQNPKNKDYDE